MISTAAIGVYALGYVLTWRLIFRTMRDELSVDDVGELAMILFASTYFNMFWPAFVLWHIWKRAVPDPAGFARTVGGESREQKAKRLERERENRECYIASLERDLGIGQ